MAYQDHLTRQIEQLGMVLRRLFTGLAGPRDPGEVELSSPDVERALDEAFELKPGTLVVLPPEQLIALLRDNPAATEANLDILADLLTSLADSPARELQQALGLRQQTLAILEHLNATSSTFNMERHGKVARLRALV